MRVISQPTQFLFHAIGADRLPRLAGRIVQVIKHHRGPREERAKIHEPTFGTKFRRRELIQLGLLNSIASQPHFRNEGFKASATTDFFFQNIRRTMLDIPQNKRLFPVVLKLLSRFTKLRSSITKRSLPI